MTAERERVMEQMVDVLVRQSTDETVQVVNLISEERFQQRTVDEMVEVTVPHIQVRIVDTITRERVPEGTVKLIFGVSVSKSMDRRVCMSKLKN